MPDSGDPAKRHDPEPAVSRSRTGQIPHARDPGLLPPASGASAPHLARADPAADRPVVQCGRHESPSRSPCRLPADPAESGPCRRPPTVELAVTTPCPPRSGRQAVPPINRLRSRAGLLLMALCLSACAAPPATTAATPCPQPTARWLQCPDGGPLVSAYEPAPDLAQYCQALADPIRRLRPVRAGAALYELPGGYRTLFVGRSGWLVFPQDKGPTDVPEGVARWWRELGCAPI